MVGAGVVAASGSASATAAAVTAAEFFLLRFFSVVPWHFPGTS